MAYALYRGTRLGLALQEALGEMEEYEQISPNVRSAVLRKFDEVNTCFYFFQRILKAIKFKTQTSVRFLRGSSSCSLSRFFQHQMLCLLLSHNALTDNVREVGEGGGQQTNY